MNSCERCNEPISYDVIKDLLTNSNEVLGKLKTTNERCLKEGLCIECYHFKNKNCKDKDCSYCSSKEKTRCTQT